MPNPPTDDRQQQVREVRDGSGQGGSEQHRPEHEDPTADDQPPRGDVRGQPGGQQVPQAEGQRERDEPDPGVQRGIAQHVLDVEPDHHRQRQQHPAGEEQRDERRHPVAVTHLFFNRKICLISLD